MQQQQAVLHRGVLRGRSLQVKQMVLAQDNVDEEMTNNKHYIGPLI